MSKPSITIAIQCHNFQRRLCWMLSSIYEQNKADEYDIVVDVAYLKGNGEPTTEEVIEYFDPLFMLWQRPRIKQTAYENIDKFQYRGITRTHQLQKCETDWMLFADTDMVYHPEYFSRLFKHLETEEDKSPIFTAGRYSNTKEITNDLVNNYTCPEYNVGYPVFIDRAWNLCDEKLDKIKRGNVGAGYFQLVHMRECPHGRVYVRANKCKDHGWVNTWQKARSDQQFRRRIGKKKKLPKWFSRNQIHLNHNRDNETKTHLEEQR